MMKTSSVSRMQRFIYSQILRYVQERWIRTQHQILLGNNSWVDSNIHHNTELWTIDGEPMEFEWNISQDSPHCSSSKKSKNSWTKWATQNNSKDEVSSCRCSMTSHGELETTNRNVLLMPHLSVFAKRFPAGHWSFLGPGSETKWYSTYKGKTTSRMGQSRWIDDDQIQWKRTPSFPSHESIVSRNAQKAKEVEILSLHFCADEDTSETVFRTNISVNQLSIHGAVSDVCEEYSTCQTRTGRPVLTGQSDPLFAPANLLTVTPRPSIEIPAQEN